MSHREASAEAAAPSALPATTGLEADTERLLEVLKPVCEDQLLTPSLGEQTGARTAPALPEVTQLEYGCVGARAQDGGLPPPHCPGPQACVHPSTFQVPGEGTGGVVTHPALATPEVSPEMATNVQLRFWDLQAASSAVLATPAPRGILASLGPVWRSLGKWPRGGKGIEPHELQAVLPPGSHLHSPAISSLCPAHLPSSACHGK